MFDGKEYFNDCQYEIRLRVRLPVSDDGKLTKSVSAWFGWQSFEEADAFAKELRSHGVKFTVWRWESNIRHMKPMRGFPKKRWAAEEYYKTRIISRAGLRGSLKTSSRRRRAR
jgi:hypothetical protein